ncbi:MAG: ribonuclease P protein component [Opitutaceae bacterium]
MRFRAEQHVRRQAEIRAVREQGRRIECRAFTIWWKRRDAKPGDATLKLPRVCVIASTKAVGSAVRRNRAKRRLREVFRQQQHHVPPGCDLMLIARDATNTWPLPQLESKFVEACRQISPAIVTETK